jgi:hypothetical protein
LFEQDYFFCACQFLVPRTVCSEDLSLWTGVSICLFVVAEMFIIIIVIGSLTGGWNSRYCNNGFYSQVLCCLKPRTGMETFILKDRELIGSENAFCPLNHVSHCFGVILIGYLVVDGNVIL